MKAIKLLAVYSPLTPTPFSSFPLWSPSQSCPQSGEFPRRSPCCPPPCFVVSGRSSESLPLLLPFFPSSCPCAPFDVLSGIFHAGKRTRRARPQSPEPRGPPSAWRHHSSKREPALWPPPSLSCCAASFCRLPGARRPPERLRRHFPPRCPPEHRRSIHLRQPRRRGENPSPP